jgi:hypothetical protein
VTPEETIDLLTVAAAFDRRTTGEADVTAWHAAIGDLEFSDSRDAIVAHYRDSGEWIMPADVRNRVKATRRDRLEREIVGAPSAELADEPGQYREAIRGRVREIADGYQVSKEVRSGGPLPGEPPEVWQEARRKMGHSSTAEDRERSLRELALRQVAESRAAHSLVAPDLGEDLAEDNPWKSVNMPDGTANPTA